jgi:hypothetical protein
MGYSDDQDSMIEFYKFSQEEFNNFSYGFNQVRLLIYIYWPMLKTLQDRIHFLRTEEEVVTCFADQASDIVILEVGTHTVEFKYDVLTIEGEVLFKGHYSLPGTFFENPNSYLKKVHEDLEKLEKDLGKP